MVPMDLNYSRDSIPPRTSSLANLVHRTETMPSQQLASYRPSSPASLRPGPSHVSVPDVSQYPSHSHRPSMHQPHSHPLPDPRRYPTRPESDDGSQQERNHQRPHGKCSRRLTPGSMPRTGHTSVDTSPKMSRKRKLSVPVDISSSNPKPEDHASSVINPVAHDAHFHVSPKHDHNEDGLDDDDHDSRRVRSRTNDDESPTKPIRRISAKDGRVELLEENRMLRVQLDAAKYRARRMENDVKRLRRLLSKRDTVLSKYRAQLVGLFEEGDDGVVQIQGRSSPVEPNAPESVMRLDRTSKDVLRRTSNRLDGESFSYSLDHDPDQDDWVSFSSGAGDSPTYDTERYDDGGRSTGRDIGNQSEATLRKRTRAPAWSAEEELKFMETYDKYGCQWKMFQNALPGRSRRQIQSHGSYLIRQGKLTKKNSRPWQRRKPRSELPSISAREDVEIDDLGDGDLENG